LRELHGVHPSFRQTTLQPLTEIRIVRLNHKSSLNGVRMDAVAISVGVLYCRSIKQTSFREKLPLQTHPATTPLPYVFPPIRGPPSGTNGWLPVHKLPVPLPRVLHPSFPLIPLSPSCHSGPLIVTGPTTLPNRKNLFSCWLRPPYNSPFA